MANINDVCDYIIVKCDEAEERLNLLKLQKLLYYCQAWTLAFTGKPLFEGKFQAWIHGPVNREIYDRFKDSKSLYSPVSRPDLISQDFNPDKCMSEQERLNIDNVLEVYAPFSDSDLEAQTHLEEPWIKARGKCLPSQRCETEMDENLMRDFYASKVS